MDRRTGIRRTGTGVISVLGVPRRLATAFPADDDVGAHPVLVLSHRYWTGIMRDAGVLNQDDSREQY